MRILVLCLIGLLLADAAPAQRRRRAQRIIRGPQGEVLARNGNIFTAVGGNPSGSMIGPHIQAGLLPKGVYEITLPNTGTGWEEKFLVGVPTNPIVPAPCLVVFHGYGQEHRDMVTKTSYFQEAMARGWVVVAPLGAHKYNYAIDYAQENVDISLNWAATYLTLDPDRFYAVGFSMGGGMASSFAARHLDTFGPRIAAAAIHTGTCSMRDVYWSADDKTLLESAMMFGGNPDQVPFRYQTASTVDLDTTTGAVDQASDMVRNLLYTPLYHFAALNDPNTFLVDETTKNHDQALLRGGDSSLTTTTDSVHQWSTLEEATVLDWLEPQTLQASADLVPSSYLADRTGSWADVYVQQVVTGTFTPFRLTLDSASNRIYLDQLENADLVRFDPERHGLDRSQTVDIVFNNIDGLAVDIVVEGYTLPPSDVQRGSSSTGSWTYDPAEQTVTLHETNAAAYPTWKIIP